MKKIISIWAIALFLSLAFVHQSPAGSSINGGTSGSINTNVIISMALDYTTRGVISTYRTAAPIFTLGSGGQFDSGQQRDTSVVYANGQYFCYYSGGVSHSNAKVGLQVSPDGTNWTRVGLVRDTNSVAGFFNSGCIFSPWVEFENGVFYMYYTGNTNNNQWYPGPAQIGLATSTDGTNFAFQGNTPLLTKDKGYEGLVGVYSPTVKKAGNTYVMLYSTSPGTQPFTICRATAPSPAGPWTKDAGNPVISAVNLDWGEEEPALVDLSNGANTGPWLVICDSLSYLQGPKGDSVFFTTNLISGSFTYLTKILTDTSGWDADGAASVGACFMTNGNLLVTYGGIYTDFNEQKTGSAVLKLGLVPNPDNSLTFVPPTGNAWYRVATLPSGLSGKIHITTTDGVLGLGGSSFCDLIVSAVLAGDPLMQGSLVQLNGFVNASGVANGAPPDKIRISADVTRTDLPFGGVISYGNVYLDIHVPAASALASVIAVSSKDIPFLSSVSAANPTVGAQTLPTLTLANGTVLASTTMSSANVSANLYVTNTVTAYNGIQFKEGSNARMGTATMNGTTAVVIANTSVTANSRIILTVNLGAGTVGSPYVSARSAATSFSIKSTAAGDTSTVAWVIYEPGS